MAESTTSESPFHYRAFISYSHADEAWASWLHKALETYRVPARLVGRVTARGTVPRRLIPVFRDREELASASDLSRTVSAALARSENLIVICSPRAAASHWVNEEIRAFKQFGRGDRIFCLLVDGEPGASSRPERREEECFAEALRSERDRHGRAREVPIEPIAADVRAGGDGKANARLKLIAGLLGVDFGQLKQREHQRRLRRMTLVTAAAVLVTLVTTSLAIRALLAERSAERARAEAERRQAQTEDLLGFMLGDLHDKLKGVGRLDLMESVADKTLTLFADQDTASLTDSDLARQSQALVQVGQIRLDEAKFESARDAFERAYRRSATLAERHPGNGNFLFDRGQAEYWIGYVHWQRRELEPATQWMTRYRDTCLQLPALDPDNLDWQLEVTYGENNLAVLALQRGRLDVAQAAFESELARQRQLAQKRPDDTELAASVADTISWLGTIAERSGDLAAAIAHFETQVAEFAALQKRYPDDRRWQSERANAEELLAAVLAATPDRERASTVLSSAAYRFEQLVDFDPKNLDWKIRLASIWARQAIVAADETTARSKAAAANSALEALVRSVPISQERTLTAVHRWMSRTWLLQARLERDRVGAMKAKAAAERALSEARKSSPAGEMDDDSLADLANALLAVGQVRFAEDHSRVSSEWQEAFERLGPRSASSRYWRLLDPWLRACRLLGKDVEANVAEARLRSIGYEPVEPWPQRSSAAPRSNPPSGENHVH